MYSPAMIVLPAPGRRRAGTAASARAGSSRTPPRAGAAAAGCSTPRPPPCRRRTRSRSGGPQRRDGTAPGLRLVATWVDSSSICTLAQLVLGQRDLAQASRTVEHQIPERARRRRDELKDVAAAGQPDSSAGPKAGQVDIDWRISHVVWMRNAGDMRTDAGMAGRSRMKLPGRGGAWLNAYLSSGLAGFLVKVRPHTRVALDSVPNGARPTRQTPMYRPDARLRAWAGFGDYPLRAIGASYQLLGARVDQFHEGGALAERAAGRPLPIVAP